MLPNQFGVNWLLGLGVEAKNRFSRWLPWRQGSGNFEIWIGPADDYDVINEPISKKKKNVYITCHENNDNWQSYNSF